MLLNLHVKNIALIDEVDIDFDEGLNILTGETGAGKSILIDSVNFALGARMPKDVVREDTTDALCELVFFTDEESVIAALEEIDVVPDEGRVILTRKITKGKSSIKCNGENITTNVAKEIASLLIDIHGQHEHQSLLYKNNHLKILDKYCGNDFAQLLLEYKVKYDYYKECLKELESAREGAGSRDADMDYSRFVVNEIENANLVIGEDVALEESYRRMNNSRKIAEAIAAVKGYLEDDEQGAASAVSRAVGYLRQVTSYDKESEGLYEQLVEIEGLISDFGRTLEDYEDSLVFSPEEFAKCEERLNEINRLKMKYAPTIEGILEHLDSETQKLEKMENIDSYLEKLSERVEKLRTEILSMCDKLSDIRKKEATKLSQEIAKSLADLNFLDSQFEIAITSKEENIGSDGYDDIEFMISTNPGEKIKPLTSVASGGELSRIMLALKAVFAGKDAIGTLIFDEIDTGISGITAQLVADKMSYISKHHQVICVTHLPQIASHADTHFAISKAVTDGRTTTRVDSLSEDESVMELARMLSGSQITDATIKNAREMKAASRE